MVIGLFFIELLVGTIIFGIGLQIFSSAYKTISDNFSPKESEFTNCIWANIIGTAFALIACSLAETIVVPALIFALDYFSSLGTVYSVAECIENLKGG